MAEAAAQPRDAALWLSPEQQEEWVATKKQVPALMFFSFLAFNGVAWLALRLINRGGRIRAPSNLVLLKAGVCAASHAVVSLAAAVYAVVHRDVSACEGRLFCHDDMSARLMTVHGGYALFELVFWQNHAGLAAPWNEMLLLHSVLTLLTCVAALMYPCRLTLVVLPLRQLLEAATLADCWRRFAAIYGAPWHARFKAQLAFCGAHILKALVSAGLAAYVYFWIRQHNLWRLELPEGLSALNPVYGIAWLAGSVVLALIHVKWMGAAVKMTDELVSSVQGKKAAAGSRAAATLAAGGKRGKRQAEKKRR